MMHEWFEILKQEKPQRRYRDDRNCKDVKLLPKRFLLWTHVGERK